MKHDSAKMTAAHREALAELARAATRVLRIEQRRANAQQPTRERKVATAHA
jgi:hypothetical protein